MRTLLIDNGKRPDQPYDARLGFWLPPDSPYGNLSLKLMKLCTRLDEANLRLIESQGYWEQLRTENPVPINSYERHTYATEQAIYLIRRTADEMIALIWCLAVWERSGRFPDKVDVDSIGNALEKVSHSDLAFCKPHVAVLTALNEIANAYKHSFVHSDITLIGRDEPRIHALALAYNRLASGITFHDVPTAWLVSEFSAFYKTGMKWLSSFSERHRQQGS